MRYALIDLNSWYIWSIQDADDPLTAAHLTDKEEGSDPTTYDDVSVSQVDGRTGYAVYTVDEDYDCDDGQDQNQIDFVTGRAAPVAYLVKTDNDDA